MVETAEGVRVEFSLAGVGSRILAATVDSLIQVVLVFALVLVAAEATSIESPWDGGTSDDREEMLIFAALVQAVIFVVFFFYYIFFEMVWSGRTPGKRAAGLRTVQLGGGPVGLKASLIRNLLRLVDLLPVAYGIGVVAIAATKRNQRLGDLVGGTVVVRERKPELPSLIPRVAVDTFLDRSLRAWDVSAVTEFEATTVRQFLARRDTIAPHARQELARELAQRLRPKVRGFDASEGDETFLEKLVAAKTARG